MSSTESAECLSLPGSARMSLGEFLRLSAMRHPDKPFLLSPDMSFRSFSEVNSRVNRLVDALRACGLTKGDRVAVFAKDSPNLCEVMLASLKLGAPLVPLNYRLARSETQELLRRINPAALFYDLDYREILAGIEEDCTSIAVKVALDELDDRCEYEELLAMGGDIEPEPVSTDADPAAFAFTSGTTGLPKAAIQSNRMLKALSMLFAIEYHLQPGDVRYTASPMYHVGGYSVLLAAAMHGFTLMIMPQFKVDRLLDVLAKDVLTVMYVVPTMLSMLLESPRISEVKTSKLRLIHYGAAPITPALLRRAMVTFECDFLNAFGATETGTQATLHPEDHRRALEEKPELLASIGKAPFGVLTVVLDENLRECAPGEIGDIASRSDVLMDGYLDMPAESAEAMRGGWFRTGDMGYKDGDGYLYLTGRKSDMIIRGGENIYPAEIEAVLDEHEDVVLSSVIGVPDDHWGEIVRAFVVTRPGAQLNEEQLREHMSAHLAKYKVPAQFRIVDALPTTASGKILKRELRLLD